MFFELQIFLRPEIVWLFCGSEEVPQNSRQISCKSSLQNLKRNSPTSFCRRAGRKNDYHTRPVCNTVLPFFACCVREEPYRSKFRGHGMRANWSVRPERCHRCISSSKSPMRAVKARLARHQRSKHDKNKTIHHRRQHFRNTKFK